MRAMLMEKASEDQLTKARNKEKNIALFNEVVRIGQELERLAAQQQQLNLNQETKFQDFEGRIQRAEQAALNVDSMRAMFTNTLAGLTEKTETRLNQADNSLNIISVTASLTNRMTTR